MNKTSRAKRRILLQKQSRQIARKTKYAEYDNFDNVITVEHFLEALKKCRKGVNWKGSVQLYTQNAIVEIASAREILQDGRIPELSSIKRIELYERGKRRVIVPITIKDRMIQRVLCDYALVPVLRDTLIYDNGASLQGKGVEFTRERVLNHIKSAISEYGSDFYALTFDFKSFFDSIPHQDCLNILRENFTDERIINATMSVIRSYQKKSAQSIKDVNERKKQLEIIESNQSRGICLGSQISQIMALAVPNELDHYIKDKRGVKHYVRYMDDGIILSDDKEYLHQLYREMIVIADKLGLTFNTKKTKIVKMSKGFVFMKVRYRVTDSGKIVRTLHKSGTVRMRRKLKKFKHLVDEEKITLDDVYNSAQSWFAHAKIANSYTTVKSMRKLYNKLYNGYKITRKYKHYTKGVEDSVVLQANKRREFRWDCDPEQLLEVST